MKTFDLKRSDRDKKAAQERMMGGLQIPMGGTEDYPYGTRISLDEDALRKLGIKDLPADQARYRIQGAAHVVDRGSNSESGTPDRRLHLQIHELGMEPVDEEAKERSIREELEDARHQARGMNATDGRIGARVRNGKDDEC